MIAPAKKSRRKHRASRAERELFEQMLPQIQRMAFVAFRDKTPELREELVAETVARAFCAFVRLAENGKADICYATPLTMFAVKQTRSGRRTGTKMNCRDVTSEYAQLSKGITVQRLDRYDTEQDQWKEVVVEDRHAGPAEVVATRIDFSDFLRSLSSRHQRIAAFLAAGEGTTATARRFRVSPGRASQIRKELKSAWESFSGQASIDGPAVLAAT